MAPVRVFVAAMAAFAAIPTAYAQPAPAAYEQTLTPGQMFNVAEQAVESGDHVTAEALLGALVTNPDQSIRSEARFRLALLYADRQGRVADGAVLLRQILDEQPDAARVRIELARLLLALNRRDDAERELLAARASKLPPEIDRLVNFYAQALGAPKRFGINAEFGIAPDTNINRATASDTLSTIIGDLDLSEDAQRQSGLGLFARSQAYGRVRIGTRTELAGTVSNSVREYDGSGFDDYHIAAELGPQWQSGGDLIALAAIAGYRWFGDRPHVAWVGARGEMRHPVGARGRLRATLSTLRQDNKRSDAQDLTNIAASVGLDRAFSSRWGGGLYLNADRIIARAEPYSNISAGLRAYLFRELGETSVALSGSWSHLEADAVLGLYGKRRVDDDFAAELSATFRSFRVGTFAPMVRVRVERHASNIEIYDFTRKSVELGVTAAF